MIHNPNQPNCEGTFWFYPFFKTLLASARKSTRLTPMRERQKTAMPTEASGSGTCTEAALKSPDRHRIRLRLDTRVSDAHAGHVADGHELTGGRQVEAVHLVLHAASDLAVAAAEVRHHERGRPGRHDRTLELV